MSRLFHWFQGSIRRVPFIYQVFGGMYARLLKAKFSGSEQYWVARYRKGGHSGPGSCSKLSAFKADFLNRFVEENQIRSIIEYGCGDGNQLFLAKYEKYTGFDISPVAIENCNAVFAGDESKQFKLMDQYSGETAELTLSLDVIYHLVEDDVFESYIERLFDTATKFVIVYSSNTDVQDPVQAPHVMHREFTRYVEEKKPEWCLEKFLRNKFEFTGNAEQGSFAHFFVFEKKTS